MKCYFFSTKIVAMNYAISSLQPKKKGIYISYYTVYLLKP